MDMEEFIDKINERNFGVVSFNTYKQNGINCCYIMIAERGDNGWFMKRECYDYELNNTLEMMLDELKTMRKVPS